MGIRNSEQLVKSEFKTDEKGNPAGGTARMYCDVSGGHPSQHPELFIQYQDGIVGDGGQNGAFVEDVIEAARQRLMFFQGSKFRCRENAIALTKLEEALQWLDWRTRNRVAQDVENTYEVHDG